VGRRQWAGGSGQSVVTGCHTHEESERAGRAWDAFADSGTLAKTQAWQAAVSTVHCRLPTARRLRLPALMRSKHGRLCSPLFLLFL
jgi:hypothetical protein